MEPKIRELLEIASPFPLENGRLRLLEPAYTCPSELSERLLRGTYDKPFILDCGKLRFLHFDIYSVQSAMRRDDPDALHLPYTRTMMAFLLFVPRPRRILLLGLGGGSLAKFCYRRIPSSTITVLETDPNVLALRDEFRVPPDDQRFRVLCGDGVHYIAHHARRKDVILADACDHRGIAPALAAADFYANVRRRLAPGGIFVMNVCGDAYECASHCARIRGVFGECVIELPVRQDGNRIVLASRSRIHAGDWAQFERSAHILKDRFGLDFPRFVRLMERSAANAGCG